MRALPRPLLAFLVAPLLVLGACTHAGDSPQANGPGVPPTATATSTPTGTPTDSATGTPSGGPSGAASPPQLANRLLPTSAVPALDPQRPWQDGQIKSGTLAPDVCARGSLLDIGASDALMRTYFPGDDSDDLTQETVAEFPDAKTTATAWSVLASFRDRCLQRLTALTAPAVGPMTPIRLADGQARWYLVTGQARGEETLSSYGIGMVEVGNRIAVVQIFTTRKGTTSPVMQKPVEQLVAAAAALLG